MWIRYTRKWAGGQLVSFLTEKTVRCTVHSHPQVAATCPRSSIMYIPSPANIVDTLGVDRFRRILLQLRGEVQLGGILEACRNTLWWLVRVVEGLVNQGAGCWEVIRIHA